LYVKKIVLKGEFFLGNRHNWVEKTLGDHMLKCNKCGEEVSKNSYHWDKVTNSVCIGNGKNVDEYGTA
jgi:hypothetical protein